MFPPASLLRRVAKPARGLVRPGRSAAALGLGLALASGAWAQTALEPDQGGTDFKIQGEYAGEVASAPMGVQVMALGSGQFKAVFFPGGLPGQGWTGAGRIEASGTLAGATASFTGGGYTAAIAAEGAAIAGKTDKAESFTFDKVMRASPTEGMAAPAGALVLFDGTGLTAWNDATATMDARKLLLPSGSSAASGAITKQDFQDFHLHLEFRVPFMPAARGQGRGNSGVYLQGRDELQVLDSFGTSLESDTSAATQECAAFYQIARPTVNAAYPPLSWQTYDIDFTAARFAADGKTMTASAIASVKWNGVLVHDKRLLAYPTLLGDPFGPTPGPLRFQSHGDPVYYRNIWIVEGNSAVKPRKASRQGNAIHALEATRLSLIDGRAVRRAVHSYRILSGPSGSGDLTHSMGATNDF